MILAERKYELRSYQKDAIETIKQKFAEGLRRFVLQAATGAGKTLLAAEVMRGAVEKDKVVLFLAHRRELINQAYKKLIEMGVPKSEVVNLREKNTRIETGDKAPHVYVGSIQLKNLPKDVDILIIDEAHRSAAKTYQSVISENPKAVLIGLTATPERLDGKPLDMYEEIVVVAQPARLVKEGFILRPRVFTVPEDFLPDTSGMKSINGDFDPDALEEEVTKQKIIGRIVEHWLQRGKGLQTICFAKSRNHSKLIVEEFVKAGVRAVHVDATTPSKERDAALRALENGDIEILSNADLFIEGVDITVAKCAILARPTESVTIYLQSVGRVLRPHEDLRAIVLDHAGNARRHGLPTIDREFDLSGRIPLDVRREREIGIKTCPSCLTENESTAVACEDCGYEFPKKGRSDMPDEESGTLVEMTDDDSYSPPEKTAQKLTDRVRLSFWNECWRNAWAHGYTPHQVHERYFKRFKENAPNHFRAPERPPVTTTWAEKEKDVRTWAAVAAKRGLPMAWVRERFEMKHGIDLDPNEPPVRAFGLHYEKLKPAEIAETKPQPQKTNDVVDKPQRPVVEMETGEL